MRSRCRLIPLVLLAVGWGCADLPTLPPKRDIDPKADEALRAMGETLAGAKQFSFRGHTRVDELLENGPMVEYTTDAGVAVKRTNKMYVTRRGDRVNRDGWYDGKTVTILDRDRNVYATVEVPSDLDDMLDFLMDKYDLVMPLADLAYAHPYEVLVQNVKSGVYLGERNVEGHPCHHLAFQQEGIDWQIWIDTSETAVPRKVIITYHKEPGHPQYEATLSGWDFSPLPEAAKFTFVPPPGVKEVSMEKLLGE